MSWFDRERLRLVYHPCYRVPLSGLESGTGMDPRRADFVAGYLLAERQVRPEDVLTPEAITWAELGRVHTAEYLESLGRAETLAAIYGLPPGEAPADALLEMSRLACGGTLLAARRALEGGGPLLNLLGGFHHAARARGGGLCALNDVAVAVATLRAEGFQGHALVLDLDAHPPDGTADCLATDPRCWLGSLSGSDWGALPGVDEVRLSPGTSDAPYLEALGALLARMPKGALAFVLAGADVRAGDRLGTLALSEQGVRQRDRQAAQALEGVPQVWLPAGGYAADAWRTLAGTALVLAGSPKKQIPERYDPLHAQLSRRARHLSEPKLRGELELTAEDVEGDLRGGGEVRLLGYYTRQGVEYALHALGLLDAVERLGFRPLRVELTRGGTGDRFCLLGTAQGKEHTLVDCTLERRRVDGQDALFVNWLSLRNPLAGFTPTRPALPGQDVPGLGMARESAELLELICHRLGLAGVVFRPAWYHLAYTARQRFHFLDPARQGRFEALLRDLAHLPLLEATHAVAKGKVLLNGEPYAWEAQDMAAWLPPAPAAKDAPELAQAREQARFTLA